MALVTEDGTGLATAESLLSVTDCDTHHAARGNATWATITTAQKEQALRRATEYMIQVYTTRWQGVRAFPLVQALDWPRYGVVVDGVSILTTLVPETVKKACAEMALKAAAGALLDDLTQGVVREKVGVIEVEYDPRSPQSVRYLAIEAMLAPFLEPGSKGISRTYRA
jgi:hypothetical protein